MAVLDRDLESRAGIADAGVAAVRRRVILALAVIFAAQVTLWTLLGDLESNDGSLDPAIARDVSSLRVGLYAVKPFKIGVIGRHFRFDPGAVPGPLVRLY